eukprot:6096468-Amphidinium_carterae.1
MWSCLLRHDMLLARIGESSKSRMFVVLWQKSFTPCTAAVLVRHDPTGFAQACFLWAVRPARGTQWQSRL